MQRFKNILAVIKAGQEQQPGLDRAVELASKTDGKVTAFMSIYDFSYEMTTMLSLEEREMMRAAVINDKQEWIASLTQKYEFPIEIVVVWHNRPYEAVVRHVIAHQTDIVVKATHQHDTLKSVIFTPTDWHLMRKCPCPVLLVKEHSWPADGEIIAAVNAGSSDTDHQNLNQKIISHAKALCGLLHSKVHLVNSYPGTPINIAIEIPEFDTQEYNNTISRHHQQAMAKLAVEHDIDNEFCHIKEGLPEDVIPQIAKDIDAELVVIGCVGRTGISAALIGNTAEHVIDNLDCDVLAIKPDGFVSSVI